MYNMLFFLFFWSIDRKEEQKSEVRVLKYNAVELLSWMSLMMNLSFKKRPQCECLGGIQIC